MKHSLLSTSVALVAFALVSCSPNPADDVSQAEVSDPTESAPAESAPMVEGTVYTLTADSKLGFVGSKVTGKHEGGFEKFSGSFLVDVANKKLVENGEHTVEIDMTSTWSDNEKLTGHLKSPDFFDVEKFPTAKFTLSSAVATDAGYDLSGNLEFHGVTKGISFPAMVTVDEDGKTVAVKADFSINRMDFGVVYPGMTDDLIREEVVIQFNVVGKPAA
ncbi:MAG: YceI family protein [Verrucomicrobiota bacterium]